MAADLVDDAEWHKMLAEFNEHFWGKRAPAFFNAWTVNQLLTPEQWQPDLKISIHGLAGVAALVNEEALGDMAREIERLWDTKGPTSGLVPLVQQLAEALMLSKAIHDDA